jgi:hypothetical protein
LGKRQEVVVNPNIGDALEKYFLSFPEIFGDHNNWTQFKGSFGTPSNGKLIPRLKYQDIESLTR